MYVEQPWTLSADRCAQLLALAGRLDIAPGPGGSRCTDAVATQAAYAPVLQDVFPDEWAHAMLTVLYPSAQLVGHRDAPIRGVRYHLPLQMNEGCWVHHDGVWVQLAVGRGYAMDPTEFHGAVNWGHAVRLHLVVDVVTRDR